MDEEGKIDSQEPSFAPDENTFVALNQGNGDLVNRLLPCDHLQCNLCFINYQKRANKVKCPVCQVNITHVTPTATLDDEGAAALGDQVAAYKGNMGMMAGEQAVYSVGDMIREKREIYEKLEKQLNDRKWWK